MATPVGVRGREASRKQVATTASWHARTRRRSIWQRSPSLLFGSAVCLGFAVAAILAPLLARYDPLYQDLESLLDPPSLAHWMGTDDLGRDLLARLLFGARISLTVALVSSAGACLVGSLVGLVSGLAGGWTDEVLMRIVDALFAFPALVLAIAVVATLGPGFPQTTAAVGVVAVPRFARLMRAQALGLRRAEYVAAARVAGAGVGRIALRHVLPNAGGVILVTASTYAGFAILAEASLSFLGLGIQPPTPAWGSMLRAGYPFLQQAPWLAIFPGVAISLLDMAFNFVGDGLRDVLDPRS